jgi:hypothetical protein
MYAVSPWKRSMLAPMTRILWLIGALVVALVGCGGEQPEECARYVACQAAYDEAFGIRPPTPTDDYEDNGVCWVSTPATAEACVQNCERATKSLREAASSAGKNLSACDA